MQYVATAAVNVYLRNYATVSRSAAFFYVVVAYMKQTTRNNVYYVNLQ